MTDIKIETERLILRKFEDKDMNALCSLLRDEEVNTFLPWFPVKNIDETKEFYQKRFAGKKYYFAVCLKEDDHPIGYIKADADDSYDFGYALRRELWGKGIITEAGMALIEQLKRDGIPYITATHDVKNPKSGNVMRRLGMEYKYSYTEQWQPKNFPVIFRMYQLNFRENDSFVYQKYWNESAKPFVEQL